MFIKNVFRIGTKRVGAILFAACAALLPVSAHAACTLPNGVAGQVIFNSDQAIMQYCNNTNWVAMNSRTAGPLNGLIGWWKLDDGAGTTVVDSSQGGGNGSFVASPTWHPTDGKVGGSLEFSGTTDYVSVPHNDAYKAIPFTISFWFKMDTLPSVAGTSMMLLRNSHNSSPWSSWSVRTEELAGANQNKVYFSVVDSGGSDRKVWTDAALVPNVWYHMVLMIDSGNAMSMYLNGKKQTSTNTAITMLNSTATLNLGGNNGVNLGFDGQLDDIRIYNRVLFASEVLQLYDLGGHAGDGLNRLALGGWHTCGLDPTGAAQCWGQNTVFGHLGNNSTSQFNTPTAVSGGHSFQTIRVRERWGCGLDFDGKLWCWGNNVGNFGDGTTTNSKVPVAAASGMRFRSFGLGSNTACGITSDGTGYCWGENDVGQVGDGTTTTPRLYPVPISGSYKWKMISGGATHFCGITEAGDAYCWGEGTYGELGNGGTGNVSVPTLVSGGRAWSYISAKLWRTCGVTVQGDGYCWGHNTGGPLGVGDAVNRNVPTAVTGAYKWTYINPGYFATCGVTLDGTGYCWGSNTTGAVGDGTTTNRQNPVAVKGLQKWVYIDGGGNGTDNAGFSCGLATDGKTWCWGAGTYGQLGDGTAADSLVPVVVSGSTVFGLNGCNRPNGVTGEIAYDTSYKIMKYCDGKTWQSMGGATFVNGGKRQPVPRPDIAHWKFDWAPAGQVFVISSLIPVYDDVGGHDGSIWGNNFQIGAAKYGQGFFGEGGGAVDIPSSTDFDTSEATWMFWFRTAGIWFSDGGDPGDSAVIMSRADTTNSRSGIAIYMGKPAFDMWFEAKNSGGTSVCTANSSVSGLADQEWHHAALAYSRVSGATTKLYIDGVLRAQCTNSAAWAFNNQDLYFGSSDDAYWEQYRGHLDDVRIYGRALSAVEIDAVYQQGAKSFPTPDVAWWTLDEASGDLASDLVGANSGTLKNMNLPAVHVAAKVSNGLDFDGTNDYVDIPLSASLGMGDKGTVSIAAWVKADVATGGLRRIFNIPHNEVAGIEKLSLYQNNGTINFLIADNTGAGVASVSAAATMTNWNHIVATTDYNTLKLYVNGVAAASTTGGNIMPVTSTNAQIGRFGPTWGQYFDGIVDDLRIYSYALSPKQVLQLYNVVNGTYQCTNPNGVEGEMIYNTASNRMQFCNSLEWVGIP